MGRKKRPAAAPAATIDASTPAYPTPIVPTAFDPYGRPLPPPLPPQQESHAQPDGGGGVDGHASKRSRADDNTGGDAVGGGGDGGITEREVYPVKRYRPDTYYRSIESFARYTKSHRMLDASYVKWKGGGGTPEKPNVFGIRIAGTFLSWGRGKTRDAAIDAAIRAAFALVAAHGYDDFAFTDDCFTEEPLHNSGAMGLAPMPPPPPPPPPLPLGLPPGTVPPLPPGLPPGFPPGMSFPLPPGMPPHGLPPNFPLPPPPNNDLMIPQPAAPKAELAVASSVGDAGGNGVPSATAIGSASSGKPSILNISTNLGSSAPLIAPPAGSAEAAKKKSNNKLVFSGDDVDEHGEELSMEEVRMRTPRYWNLVVRAMNKRIRNDDDLVSSS